VRSVRVFAFASVMLAWALRGFAQQSVDYASIGGRVLDQTGAAVAGAQVRARHIDTNVTTATLTDGSGRFRLPALRIGNYELIVRQAGFKDAAVQLTLAAGAAFEVPVSLQVADVTAEVTVAAGTPVLDAARSQITATVSEVEVRSLPLNGRNFQELALVVPGVSPTNLNSTQLFPETSAVLGASLSVSSQRNLSNNFIVDGLSANDDAAALGGITYAVDAVEQFQVVTSGGQAELGRALGGYMNVVTRSGTNVLHGTGYAFVRDDSLNAPNSLSGTRLPMDQWQYGGSLGGPIARNRTFYFANIEQRRLDQTGLTTISTPSTALINARLAAAGYQGPPVATGTYPNPIDSTNLMGKIDHEANAQGRFGVRLGLYDVSSQNARGAGGLNAPSASSNLDNLDRTIAASHAISLSARTLLETRAQIAASRLDAPPSDPIGPAVSIAGVAVFGTSSGSPTHRKNTMYQVVSNLSHQAGAHALRAGLDVLVNDDRIVYPRAARGSYVFSSLANFLTGLYNNAGFTQTFAVSEVVQQNPNVGMYVQDEWKLNSDLTLNAGVRYDLQFLESINTDLDNISPRVGVAWSPFDDRRTIVRGSAGMFYDRVPLRAVANALLSAGNTTDLTQLRQISVSLSPAQAAAPVFPRILDAPSPSVTLPTLTTMDRDLQNAVSRQAGVEIERQIRSSMVIGIGYQYTRGRQLLMSINQNVPSCVAAGSNNGCRPYPEYGNNNRYSSAGSSSYHGMHVSLTQRPGRWGHYRVSYTLSSARNNVGEFFFSSPIDPFDLSKDWGRSDNDQRHRLVLSGTAQSPTTPAGNGWETLTRNWQLSGLLQAYSALPFNITSGVTTIQGTAGRPVVNGQFIERNAGEGSDFFSLGLRVSRTFHLTSRIGLEALAEAFNVTNRENVLTRNTNFGSGSYPDNPSPNFGQPTAVGEPRSFQLGARLRF
jgi:carboxypeptidase family protein/TonB-dependent receptor-like protein